MQGSSLARLGACGLLQGRPGGDTARGRAQPAISFIQDQPEVGEISFREISLWNDLEAICGIINV